MKNYLLVVFFVMFVSNALQAVDSLARPQIHAPTNLSISTFKDSQKGFTFQYPSNWTKNEQVQGFDIFIMAPKEANGKSLANVSVISGNLPEEVELELYTKENVKNLLKDIPAIQVKESGKTVIDGIPANWIRYIRTDDETEIIHYFFVRQGVGFLITCGAAVEAFDQYQSTFEAIVNSFKFIKSNGSNKHEVV